MFDRGPERHTYTPELLPNEVNYSLPRRVVGGSDSSRPHSPYKPQAAACTIRIPAFQFYLHGGSGLIRGSCEAAGGHCPRGGGIRPPEKVRAKFHGAVSIPFREDAFVCSASGEADLSLLRVRCWRRRLQIRDGDGQDHV